MPKTKILFRTIAILSLFCFLTDVNMTYHWHYMFEKSGFGFNFWMVTLRWWCFWIVVSIGAFLTWRPIMLLILAVSPFIIKWGIVQLSGIQAFFYNFPLAKSFYFQSLQFPENLDAIAKLIFITFNFINLCLIVKEIQDKKTSILVRSN